ncbi:MAG: hypothetical protein IPG99_00800 [Ignavibacteria bacterium]|nr:hypothetical protein [Ignavibacteria bacterium]
MESGCLQWANLVHSIEGLPAHLPLKCEMHSGRQAGLAQTGRLGTSIIV